MKASVKPSSNASEAQLEVASHRRSGARAGEDLPAAAGYVPWQWTSLLHALVRMQQLSPRVAAHACPLCPRAWGGQASSRVARTCVEREGRCRWQGWQCIGAAGSNAAALGCSESGYPKLLPVNMLLLETHGMQPCTHAVQKECCIPFGTRSLQRQVANYVAMC